MVSYIMVIFHNSFRSICSVLGCRQIFHTNTSIRLLRSTISSIKLYFKVNWIFFIKINIFIKWLNFSRSDCAQFNLFLVHLEIAFILLYFSNGFRSTQNGIKICSVFIFIYNFLSNRYTVYNFLYISGRRLITIINWLCWLDSISWNSFIFYDNNNYWKYRKWCSKFSIFKYTHIWIYDFDVCCLHYIITWIIWCIFINGFWGCSSNTSIFISSIW